MDPPQENLQTDEKQNIVHRVPENKDEVVPNKNQAKLAQIFSERIILLQFLFLKLLASIFLLAFLSKLTQLLVIYIVAFTLIFLQTPIIFGSDGFLSISVRSF